MYVLLPSPNEVTSVRAVVRLSAQSVRDATGTATAPAEILAYNRPRLPEYLAKDGSYMGTHRRLLKRNGLYART